MISETMPVGAWRLSRQRLSLTLSPTRAVSSITEKPSNSSKKMQ